MATGLTKSRAKVWGGGSAERQRNLKDAEKELIVRDRHKESIGSVESWGAKIKRRGGVRPQRAERVPRAKQDLSPRPRYWQKLLEGVGGEKIT